MNILYCTTEAIPFAASGGLADVAGSLPGMVNKCGQDCRVVMPLYAVTKEKFASELTYVCNFTVAVSWRNQYCGLFTLQRDGVTYYFLDNEYYFARKDLYGYYDDAERFVFFSRACLEMIKHMDFIPDIIHCNDWQTALVPVYLELLYCGIDLYSNIKTVFTIHNIQYQGKYGLETFDDLVDLPRHKLHMIEYDNCINFIKGAIECSNKISTVSPSYAQEILDPWFSHGLDDILNQKKYKLCGILNGISTTDYDPATDKNIEENYTIENYAKHKLACKHALQKEFGLSKGSAPVVGMVTRLVAHKGLDIVKRVAQEIVDNGMQLVILGNGDSEYENFFTQLANENPGTVGVKIGFIPALARKVYAGSDIFLMPSKSEPCGLSQMVALRYGTVPVVRETGGLRDSIKDSADGIGNGFTFSSYSAAELLQACKRAKDVYKNKKEWANLVQRAMRCDCSWNQSARQYVQMYEQVNAML